MKANILILTVLGLMLVFQSCDKQGKEPYVIFKDSNAKVINQDTIEVELISVQELIIESGFKGSSPKYLRQINNGDIVDISDSNDVKIMSHLFAEIEVEKAVLTTNISDMNLTNGSIIRTTVRLGTDVSKSKYYKIK